MPRCLANGGLQMVFCTPREAAASQGVQNNLAACRAIAKLCRMARRGYVYILASQKNGTLYTGVTSDLPGRLHQHRTGSGSKFAARYGVVRLVWFEDHDWIIDAIAREKAIKKWPRQWKIKLIEENNPTGRTSHFIF